MHKKRAATQSSVTASSYLYMLSSCQFPCNGADNTIRCRVMIALERFDRALSAVAEDTIKAVGTIPVADQEALQRLCDIALGSDVQTYRRGGRLRTIDAVDNQTGTKLLIELGL